MQLFYAGIKKKKKKIWKKDMLQYIFFYSCIYHSLRISSEKEKPNRI